MARGKPTETHCANGHEFTPENTYIYPPTAKLAGKRVCKVCRMNSIRKNKGLSPIERMTVGVWNRNKTHCPKGHPYDDKNTRVKADGSRGCKQCHRDGMRTRTYDLPVTEYEALLEAQSNLCAICQDPKAGKLHVDHDHSTNAVRGLLCNSCNNGLGRFRDNPDRLRAAALYLEKVTNKENLLCHVQQRIPATLLAVRPKSSLLVIPRN